MTSSNIVERHIPCDNCGSSDAKCVYDDGHAFCFSCNTHFPAEGKKDNSDYTFEYYGHRGISKRTFEFYDVKSKIDDSGKPIAVGFVYPSGDCQVRSLEEKDFYWATTGPKDKTGLFGRNKFAAGSHKTVTITEGAYDALSLYEVLHSPVVAVQSASSAYRDCSNDRSWLNSFERVYLAFDGDEPGRDATREVAKLFDYNKVYHVRFDKRKDANEYLVAGERSDLINLWSNARRYVPEEIEFTFDAFDRILSEEPSEGVPYPFPTLNSKLFGMRKKEIVLITAPEGVGKSEILRACEYQILKETDYNVGCISPEEPNRGHLERLATLQLGFPVHLPGSGCTKDQKLAAIKELLVQDERLHLYAHAGSSDPDVLLDTVRFLATARSCGFICLDNFSMGVSGLLGEDERRALDYQISHLAAMVQELDFGLIITSHINDFGQTRGSRAIAHYAHIRIAAERDMENEDPVTARTIKLRVKKNRPCILTGNAGDLLFDLETCSLKEIGGEDVGFHNHQTS